jgi:hypothetical protein
MLANTKDYRFEFKYRLNSLESLNINDYLRSNSKIFKIYPSRNIHSIYYDTYNLKFISENLSGISERKKFRIRWYNNNQEKIIAEVKIRKNKLVTKIKKNIKVKKNFNFIRDLNSIKYNQSLDEIFFKFFANDVLQPKVKISYSRDYFYYKGLIITVDKDLEFLDLKTNQIFNFKNNIIEIKFPENKLDLFNTVESNFPFRITRNSKYVLAMSSLGYSSYL